MVLTIPNDSPSIIPFLISTITDPGRRYYRYFGLEEEGPHGISAAQRELFANDSI